MADKPHAARRPPRAGTPTPRRREAESHASSGNAHRLPSRRSLIADRQTDRQTDAESRQTKNVGGQSEAVGVKGVVMGYKRGLRNQYASTSLSRWSTSRTRTRRNSTSGSASRTSTRRHPQKGLEVPRDLGARDAAARQLGHGAREVPAEPAAAAGDPAGRCGEIHAPSDERSLPGCQLCPGRRSPGGKRRVISRGAAPKINGPRHGRWKARRLLWRVTRCFSSRPRRAVFEAAGCLE